jgi:diguanylate cyclase (GGDEF)-like protein
VTALAALAETATGDFTIDELLYDLCVVAVRALDVDGAGVMISEPGGLRFIHAAPERVVDVESLQEVLQRGPCQDCMRDRVAITIDDITKSERWPEFADAAAGAGLRATVAMPLLARGEAWGALDVYHNTEWTWTGDQVSMARLFAGIAASYLVMASDRDLARAARHDLEYQATHDELTGLPGRGLLFTLLEHAIAVAHRRETAVAVLFVDLDRFKNINDTLGHAAGDFVLIEAAQRLKQALRDQDTLARLAGDEFVIVCEGLPRDTAEVTRQLETLGHRLESLLSRPMFVANEELVVSASIGVAVTSEHSSTEDLLGDADSAMYMAKRRGRGKLVVGGRRPDSGPPPLHSLERDLELALARDELRVHYQPIVMADTVHTVVAAEVLLRWQHPEHGLLTADTFIGLAERSASIVAIGRWVMDRASAQLMAWQRLLGDAAPKQVFVNVSPREVADPEFDAAVAAVLNVHGMPPSALGLEIVENDFVDSLLLPRLAEQHAQGHPLAVDDFGTGYCSLTRLVDIPGTYAKIDRTFVAGLRSGIVGLAHHLDLTVIAKGVETQQQVVDLAAAGCDLLQGYHLGRPQPAEALTARWVRAQQARPQAGAA